MLFIRQLKVNFNKQRDAIREKLFAYLFSCYCNSHLQGCVNASKVLIALYLFRLINLQVFIDSFLKFIATVFALCNVVENFHVL